MNGPSSKRSPWEWYTAYYRRRSLAKMLLNWMAMIFLTTCAIASLFGIYATYQNGGEPRPIPLSTLFAADPVAEGYVEVTGLLFPETNLTYPAARDGKYRPIQYTYVAMIEDDPKKVFLVRFSGDRGQGEPRHATIAGLLTAPDANLRRFLKSEGGKIGGLPIEARYFLLAGVTPTPLWLSVVVALMFCGMLTPFVIAEYRCILGHSRSFTSGGE